MPIQSLKIQGGASAEFKANNPSVAWAEPMGFTTATLMRTDFRAVREIKLKATYEGATVTNENLATGEFLFGDMDGSPAATSMDSYESNTFNIFSYASGAAENGRTYTVIENRELTPPTEEAAGVQVAAIPDGSTTYINVVREAAFYTSANQVRFGPVRRIVGQYGSRPFICVNDELPAANRACIFYDQDLGKWRTNEGDGKYALSNSTQEDVLGIPADSWTAYSGFVITDNSVTPAINAERSWINLQDAAPILSQQLILDGVEATDHFAFVSSAAPSSGGYDPATVVAPLTDHEGVPYTDYLAFGYPKFVAIKSDRPIEVTVHNPLYGYILKQKSISDEGMTAMVEHSDLDANTTMTITTSTGIANIDILVGFY